MAISRVRLSQLPKVDSLKDVSTLGYKKEGNTNISYQVPLDLVQDATDRANNAAATIDAKIESRVPINGQVGQVLIKGEGGNSWVDIELQLAYGIEWDTTVANSACKRIGNLSLHKSLPIQSKMRRCLLKDDGTVNYYLDANDSSKKESGTPAILNGADGQVMVEIPDMYVKFEEDGTKRRCLMSTHPLGGFIKWGKSYISAYEAAIDKTNTAKIKLSSVINMTAPFRGGSGVVGWDGTYRTLLGKPLTAQYDLSIRAYARNRGAHWEQYTYSEHVKLTWLMSVEYADFNIQLPFNTQLTSEGFRQGGLGDGVTTLDITKWTDYNVKSPFIACGTTNSLGNNSGTVPFTMPIQYGDDLTVQVPNYRGIENPFGHLSKFAEGSTIVRYGETAKVGFFVCKEAEHFGSKDLSLYQMRGHRAAANMGYIKNIRVGEHGDIFCSESGASTSTHFCDRYILVDQGGAEYYGVIIVCGTSNTGADAGMFYMYSYSRLGMTAARDLGTRLCFIPK